MAVTNLSCLISEPYPWARLLSFLSIEDVVALLSTSTAARSTIFSPTEAQRRQLLAKVADGGGFRQDAGFRMNLTVGGTMQLQQEVSLTTISRFLTDFLRNTQREMAAGAVAGAAGRLENGGTVCVFDGEDGVSLRLPCAVCCGTRGNGDGGTHEPSSSSSSSSVVAAPAPAPTVAGAGGPPLCGTVVLWACLVCRRPPTACGQCGGCGASGEVCGRHGCGGCHAARAVVACEGPADGVPCPGGASVARCEACAVGALGRCSSCLRTTCTDCRRVSDCAACRRLYCGRCRAMVVCSRCERSVCKGCNHECDLCVQYRCIDCLKVCYVCDAKICLNCGPPFADCYCGQRTYCRRCECECRNAAARCTICQQKCCVDCCRRRKDMRKGTIACARCNPRPTANGHGDMDVDAEDDEIEGEVVDVPYATDTSEDGDDAEEGVEVSSMDDANNTNNNNHAPYK